MILFLLSAVLTLLVVAILAKPYFSGPESAAAPEEFNLTVYKDQLAELKRDVARGTVLPHEEEAARLEIERRMLAASQMVSKTKASTPSTNPAIFTAIIGILPILAGVVYFAQGRPDMESMPFVGREDLQTAPDAVDGLHAGMANMVTTLSERLEENPDDVEGWALMARSLVNLNRHEDAVEAYRQANRLVGGRDKQLASEYAETLVIANNGIVGEESRNIFDAFIEEDQNDPQANYYLALAKAQEGNVVGALQQWQTLLDNSPADAPWVSVVERQISRVVEETGVARPVPTAKRGATSSDDRFIGPTASDIAAARVLPQDQQAQMIDGMVAGLAARLEETPDDLQGWRRLARSYVVLGRSDEARSAYREVLRLAPDDPDAKAYLQQD